MSPDTQPGPLVVALSLLLLPACLDYPEPQGGDSGLPSVQDDRWATLQGTVTDGSGSPVAGAWLTTLPRGYEATSDADGSFVIDRLPADSYQVVAAADGLLSDTSDTVTVAAGETASLDLSLATPAPGGTLSVRLIGPDDAPLAAASVQTSAGLSGTTDADGLVVLEGAAGAGLTVTLGQDARTWPRVVGGLEISDAGGEQLAFQLSGRPPDGAGYLGTSYCMACHPDAAEDHGGTLHADALSESLPDEILERFQAGETVDLGSGAVALLEDDGGDPLVTLIDASGTADSYVVEGLIGSAMAAGVPWVEDGDQAWPLPLAWVAEDPERGPDYPDGAARWEPYQVDRWLDADGDRVALDPARSAEAACLPCHATGFELALRDDGGVDMSATSGGGRWTDTGVQCERCHGPGADHFEADDADRPFTITSPELLGRDRSNDACGQCHSNTLAHESGLPYPFTGDASFQPGMDLDDFAGSNAQRWDNGTSAYGRQQLDDLQLSPHGDATLGMVCLDCHAPHGEGGYPHQGRLNPDDNSLCLSCHLDRTFGGDASQINAEHVDHPRYDPVSDHQTGRCATCHMPATAATVAFSELSGAGDVSSHLYTVVPPQETVDAFDAAGATSLDVGSFPIHSCAECHAYGQWWWDSVTSTGFPGPVGDPTLRQTHVEYQEAYEEKYP